MGATFTHTASPLPPDIRVMNGVAGLLLLAVALAAAAVGVHWLARQPAFSIKSITVEGDVSRNSSASLRANALPRLSGNFLTMNLQQARAAFEAVPWVRHATVRRVWPLHLVVALEEHRPAAYWETKAENADADSDAVVDTRLVNSFGEVFEANLGDVEDEDLPTLAGPAKKLHYGHVERFPMTLRNDGPDGAWQPQLTLRGDAPAANVAIDAPDGWDCTVDGDALRFQMRCRFDGVLGSGASTAFDARIRIPARPNSTQFLTLVAATLAASTDEDDSDNSADYANRIVGVP